MSTPSASMPAAISHPNRRHLGKALLLSGAIAALVGIGVGLAIRLGFRGVSPAPIFNTEQSFPTRSDWPGSVPAEESDTDPYEEGGTPERYSSPSYSAPLPERSPTPVSPSPTEPSPPATETLSDPAVPPMASPLPGPVVPSEPDPPAIDPAPAPVTDTPPPAPEPEPAPLTPAPAAPTTP